MSEYTPTTEEIIRSFSIPPHRIVERGEDESFSEYLARLSIEGHGYQMESEAAARRWLAAHDAEVLREAADALDGTTSGLNPENPLELAYFNCTRIDAQELRHRANRMERGEQ